MQKKWIFLGGTLLCLLVAAWAFYNYQKPREGIAASNADYTLNAESLYNQFATNEVKANDTYNGKIITVRGLVTEVQKTDNATIIILKGSNDGGGVSCSFTSTKAVVEWPAVGAKAAIKGRCTGFLMDVNLVDAVFVK